MVLDATTNKEGRQWLSLYSEVIDLKPLVGRAWLSHFLKPESMSPPRRVTVNLDLLASGSVVCVISNGSVV